MQPGYYYGCAKYAKLSIAVPVTQKNVRNGMRYVVKENPEDPPPYGYHHYPLVVWDNEAKRIVGRYNTDGMAHERADYLNWYITFPMGQRTGELLKRVRSILSSAEKAVVDNWGRTVDQEEQEILKDLQQVTTLLRKWQRTGSTPRRN